MEIWLLLAVTAISPGGDIDVADLPASRDRNADVAQIETSEKPQQGGEASEGGGSSGKPDRYAVTIGQLPADAEPLNDDDNMENSLAADDIAPGGRLYAEVAEVWTMIRKRGLQPTPELIAREIGPDALTQFLDLFPAASDIFGKDSDSLPIDRDDSRAAPEGIFTVPPSGSGGL